MSEEEQKPKYLDAKQVVYLPKWARFGIMAILALLATAACITAISFLFWPEHREEITAVLSIAQTAAGGFAVVLFVLFAERQLSTKRLHDKTDEFLEKQVLESLSKIEIPQIKRGQTVNVNVLKREDGIHGGRKDIYGANYHIFMEQFQMRFWVGINVKRLSTIYFVKVDSEQQVDELARIFRFTFGGAAKVGYETNFEYAEIDGEKIVSIWSTAMADNAILGNPAEQLFWVQDIAMMTQSVIRTAVRHNIRLYTNTEPGPL
ncbi:hypothetical protein [Herbaspirillum rhizosphaerae]|uniref:hypothetical protein n=1 Tax=Herbaspirillum rhizosphaerae TaxID=346179 RepID=UPI00067BC5E9|nr:hypothetical protein [Herbaspirillum rhizosphaerae]